MRSLHDFAKITSTELPTQVSDVIAAAAIEKLEEVGFMRPHCFVDTSPEPGDKKYYPIADDEMGDGFTRKSGEDWKYDGAGMSTTGVDIEELCKGFQIDFDSKYMKQIKILAGKSKQSMDKTRKKEDTAIAAVLSGATHSVTGSGVLSGTSADPVKDVAQAIRKVRRKGYTANVLFIEDVNYEELTSIIASNDWLKVTEELISKGILPKWQGLRIQQLAPTDLTHGTAYVGHCSSEVGSALWLGEAKAISEKIFDDNENHMTKVQHYVKVGPALARPDAMAKITGW